MESYKPLAFKDGTELLDYGAYALDHHFYSCAEYVQGSELGSMTLFVVFPHEILSAMILAGSSCFVCRRVVS